MEVQSEKYYIFHILNVGPAGLESRHISTLLPTMEMYQATTAPAGACWYASFQKNRIMMFKRYKRSNISVIISTVKYTLEKIADCVNHVVVVLLSSQVAGQYHLQRTPGVSTRSFL